MHTRLNPSVLTPVRWYGTFVLGVEKTFVLGIEKTEPQLREYFLLWN